MLSLAWPVAGVALMLAAAGFSLRRFRPLTVTPLAVAERPPPHRFPDEQSEADMLDLLPHPVLALARDGVLVHANQTARQQFGDALTALLRHPRLGEAILALPSDETRSVEVAMDVPVRRVLRVVLRGDSRRIILSLMDHTEKEAVERMRADFVAYASHELRTPLASLIGFIDTLMGPAADDPPAQRRFLAIMAEQAARMRRLIDNLLALSRIQMTEHERPRGTVSVAPLARRVAEAHEPQCRDARVVLTLEIDDTLPQVTGDADQLAQVLHNLLDNAVKYAVRPDRGGSVLLAARAAPAADGSALAGIVLEVRDDGPGIEAHHVPRLTERFYRVEERSAGKAGSGLGLSIVKHIVGRHGGRLVIDSTPGIGSSFSVWLPVQSVTKLSR